MSSTTASTPLIEFQDLRKSFGEGESRTEVLHGLDLKINQGEFAVIMGTSGSGKSTLMNIIGTLDRPTSGTYLFKGQRIDSFTSEELAQLRNREIGFVFQSFNLLPRINVARNLERPMMYGHVPQEERKDRIHRVLEVVGLAHKITAMPLNLSGGQQQRIAIARALIMSPPLILADEPTGALDSKTAEMVMKELQRINQETGTTIILVTHDDKTASYGNRLIRVQDGRIVK